MMFFTVSFVFEVQAQSPTAAKLKPPSILFEDSVDDNAVCCRVVFLKSTLFSAPC